MYYNSDNISQEQNIALEYCCKTTRNRAIICAVVLLIIFIPFAVLMTFLIYLSIVNPTEICDSVSENIIFLIFFIVMLACTIAFMYYYILLPIIRKSFYKKILVSENGIFSQVNNNFIPWEEVKMISIGLTGLKNSINSYIFIQHENFKLNPWSIKNIIYHDDLISMECTQEKINTVQQFYDFEIENISTYKPKVEKKIMTALIVYAIICLLAISVIFIWIFFFYNWLKVGWS